MPKVTFELITLKWEKVSYKEFPQKPGIYQIYGTSPLYGIDTLLYIGQAINLNSRIKDHIDFKQGVIGRQANLSCRFALAPTEFLTVVEQTLIVMYKPSFNAIGLKNISKSAKESGFYIQNEGERGLLNHENTNYYFLNQLKHIVDTRVDNPEENNSDNMIV